MLWLKSCSLTPKNLNYGDLSGSMTEHDDDVYDEKRRIATSVDDQDVLVIRELTKVFPGRRGRPLIHRCGLFNHRSPNAAVLCCNNCVIM